MVLPENALNGGFPEPPADAPIRVIAARHAACGEETRVRLPSTLSPLAVRRLECAGCASAFEAERVEEVGPRLSPPKLAPPKLAKPRLPSLDPDSRSWKLLSIPIAAVLVLGGLLLLRGGDEPATPAAPPASEQATTAPPASRAGAGAAKAGEPITKASGKTEFVRESTFSLALPAGWERVDPPAGATFSAVAADGGADATLWITRDPKLAFPDFVNQSLAQLETLAGSARIVERVPGPTAESTVVRLAADAPPGQPSYSVTLRVAGPYRYYLATSVQPDASAAATKGSDLVNGTFIPEVGPGG